MVDNWYHRQGKTNHGPMTRADLERRLDAGQVLPQDFVWQEGTPEWVPARTVFPPERFASPLASAPPLPSGPPDVPMGEPVLDDEPQRRGEPMHGEPMRGEPRDYDRPRDDRRDYPDRFEEPRRPPEDVPYPSKLRTAGIIWIVMGGLILVFNGLGLIISLANAPPGAAIGAGVCGGGFIAFLGGGFIFVGIQSCTGSAPGVMGNGVGSIIFAALVLGYGILFLVATQNIPAAGVGFIRFVGVGLHLLAAAALLIAGVMAIQSDQQYRDWRYVHRPPPRRRPRRYDDEYDYERRPRR